MIAIEAARALYEEMKQRPLQSRNQGLMDDFLTKSGSKKVDPLISVDWVINGGDTQPKPRMNYLAAPDNKKWKPPENEVLLACLHFACLIIHKYRQQDGIYIPELDDNIRAVNRLMVYWHKYGGVKGEPISMGYDIPAGAESEIELLLKTNGTAAKEIVNRLAMNVFTGAQLSSRMRGLIHSIMTGYLELPNPPAREPTQRQRDTLLVALADGIRDRTFYHGGANQIKFHREEPTPICGCTIAAAAMAAYGFHIDPPRAHKIYGAKAGLPLSQIDMRRFCSVPPFIGATLLDGEQEDVTELVIKALNYFT